MHKYGATTIITNAQKLYNRIEYNPYIYIFIKITKRIQFVCVHDGSGTLLIIRNEKNILITKKLLPSSSIKSGKKWNWDWKTEHNEQKYKNIFNQFAYLLSDYRKKSKLLLNFVLFLFLFV